MIVRAPAYGIEVHLHRTADALHAARELAYGRPLDPLPPCKTGRTVELESGGRVQYLIGWFDGRRSTLAHEAGHVAHMAFERLGLNPGRDHGEEHCRLAADLFGALGGDDTNG